jgi:hypothetical protein
MIAKKTAPKTTESAAANTAPLAVPAAKKVAKTAAKTVEKTANQPAAAKTAAKKVAVKKSADAKPAPKITSDTLARAAYLNYRRRVEQGLPGDSHGDWLEAERSLGKSTGS